MRLTRSLLPIAAALALSGAAFAGEDRMSSQSHEASTPELLSDRTWDEPRNPDFPLNGSESAADMQASATAEPMAESGMIYVYPVEVTEYYILVPSEETPLG